MISKYYIRNWSKIRKTFLTSSSLVIAAYSSLSSMSSSLSSPAISPRNISPVNPTENSPNIGERFESSRNHHILIHFRSVQIYPACYPISRYPIVVHRAARRNRWKWLCNRILFLSITSRKSCWLRKRYKRSRPPTIIAFLLPLGLATVSVKPSLL